MAADTLMGRFFCGSPEDPREEMRELAGGALDERLALGTLHLVRPELAEASLRIVSVEPLGAAVQCLERTNCRQQVDLHRAHCVK
nr:hypothetical protein [Polyangium aurulentum]